MPSIPSQEVPVAGPSRLQSDAHVEESNEDAAPVGLGEGMNVEGFSGPSQKTVKPLTPEALAAFKAAQDKAGIVYISRIPPGMQPAKVRHLMGAYGEVGRVYLQQEGTEFRSAIIQVKLMLEINRPEAGLSEEEIHVDQEGSFHRRMGRVQGQENCTKCCGYVECSANRREKGVALERRCVDDEVFAQIQVEYVDRASR